MTFTLPVHVIDNWELSADEEWDASTQIAWTGTQADGEILHF